MATAVASSPGRVTVIGEHTDYNEGRALGVATAQRTTVKAAAGTPGALEITSTIGTASCAIDAPAGPPFAVLAAALARAAGVQGVRLEVTSDLPMGAGLASSAAYAVAVALALGIEGDAVTVARACQAAEREAGSDVGLLDQLVALEAREGTAVLIGFEALSVAHVPVRGAIGLTVVDTGERRALRASPYAQRRAECARAAEVIGPLGRATAADVATLRDPVLARRARHVVTECARVDEARRALEADDLGALGSLLDAGHASLRDEFEASTPGVEAVRDAVRAQPGIAGVRLTGAGFGGCLVVAHEPDASVAAQGRWSTRLRPGAGASVSPGR